MDFFPVGGMVVELTDDEAFELKLQVSVYREWIQETTWKKKKCWLPRCSALSGISVWFQDAYYAHFSNGDGPFDHHDETVIRWVTEKEMIKFDKKRMWRILAEK